MKYTTSMKDSQINFYFEGSGAGSHIYYCPPNWPAQQNLYYWSIPKNASTLIRKLFKLNPKNFDSTLSFTILREPWSRLKSAFVMGIGEKYKCQYTMQQISDWLIKDTNGCNADLMVHFIQQSKYLEYRPYKHVPIDHWFIMEDMPSLACFLGKIWNRPWKEFEVVGDSYYPEHFDEIYDTWLDNNKNWAEDWLAYDIELYTSVIRKGGHGH